MKPGKANGGFDRCPHFSRAAFRQPSRLEGANAVDADAKGFFSGDLPFHFSPSDPLITAGKFPEACFEFVIPSKEGIHIGCPLSRA
jgi:hypothetical protein